MALLAKTAIPIRRFAACYLGTILWLVVVLLVERFEFIPRKWSRMVFVLVVIVIPVFAFFVGIGWGKKQDLSVASELNSKHGFATAAFGMLALFVSLGLWLVTVFWLADKLATFFSTSFHTHV